MTLLEALFLIFTLTQVLQLIVFWQNHNRNGKWMNEQRSWKAFEMAILKREARCRDWEDSLASKDLSLTIKEDDLKTKEEKLNG